MKYDLKNRLKDVRIEHKLTQKEVSKSMGIPVNTYSNYERGDRIPQIETWEKLARYFRVPIPYLQGVNDKRNKIHDLIQQRGMDEQEVANVLDIDMETLIDWEVGKIFPSVEQLKMLSDCLAVPFEYLTGFIDKGEIDWLSDIIVNDIKKFEEMFPDIKGGGVDSRFEIVHTAKNIGEMAEVNFDNKELTAYLEFIDNIAFLYKAKIPFDGLIKQLDDTVSPILANYLK